MRVPRSQISILKKSNQKNELKKKHKKLLQILTSGRESEQMLKVQWKIQNPETRDRANRDKCHSTIQHRSKTKLRLMEVEIEKQETEGR
jgi:hypothetical protein